MKKVLLGVAVLGAIVAGSVQAQVPADRSVVYRKAGFQIMAMPTDHPVEALTGLGASGVDLILAYVGAHPLQGHPLLPVLQIAATDDCPSGVAFDLDVLLAGDDAAWPDLLLARIGELAAHDYVPKGFSQGNIDFQITRGLLGISL